MSIDALGNFAGKRLAVFGAGYVGSALVEEAVRQRMHVVALTRNSTKAGRLAEAGAKIVIADLASDDWHKQIESADYVVNCVSSGGGGASAYQRSYVEGSQSIVRWLGSVQAPEVFVYTSSTSVYPQSGGTVDEAASTVEAQGNAVTLLAAEDVVRMASQQDKCRRSVILRLAGIYGPERHHILDQLREGVRPLLGRGNHRLNLIYRDDIVAALCAVMSQTTSERYQVFNVVDDNSVRKSELVTWLATKIGVPPPEFSNQPVPGRRPDPPDRVVSNAKIKATLGWRPRFPDFRAGYTAILGA